MIKVLLLSPPPVSLSGYDLLGYESLGVGPTSSLKEERRRRSGRVLL